MNQDQAIERWKATEQIKTNLETLPGKIADIETEMIRMQNELEEAKLVMKSIENSAWSKVVEEINPDTGKPRYTNESQRRSATDVELSISPSVIELKKRIVDTARKIAEETIRRDFLSRNFRAAEALARMGVE